MKRHVWVWMLAGLLLGLGGCVAPQVLNRPMSPDSTVLEQVPAERQGAVHTAEAAQLAAAEQLNLEVEKVALAKLQKELAGKQERLARYAHERADLAHEAAVVAVDLAKWEAIDAADVGVKEQNIKVLFKLGTRKAKLEESILRVEKDQSTLQLRIEELGARIAAQRGKVDAMQAAIEAAAAPGTKPAE